MGIIIYAMAILLWWVVATYEMCFTGVGQVQSGAVAFCVFIVAIPQAMYWRPVITLIALMGSGRPGFPEAGAVSGFPLSCWVVWRSSHSWSADLPGLKVQCFR